MNKHIYFSDYGYPTVLCRVKITYVILCSVSFICPLSAAFLPWQSIVKCTIWYCTGFPTTDYLSFILLVYFLFFSSLFHHHAFFSGNISIIFFLLFLVDFSRLIIQTSLHRSAMNTTQLKILTCMF